MGRREYPTSSSVKSESEKGDILKMKWRYVERDVYWNYSRMLAVERSWFSASAVSAHQEHQRISDDDDNQQTKVLQEVLVDLKIKSKWRSTKSEKGVYILYISVNGPTPSSVWQQHIKSTSVISPTQLSQSKRDIFQEKNVRPGDDGTLRSV